MVTPTTNFFSIFRDDADMEYMNTIANELKDQVSELNPLLFLEI
jgi:hypothetical protein